MTTEQQDHSAIPAGETEERTPQNQAEHSQPANQVPRGVDASWLPGSGFASVAELAEWLDYLAASGVATSAQNDSGIAVPCAAVARITAAEIFEPLLPITWVCEGIELAAGAPTVLGGLGGAGKSFLAQDLALAVATGGKAWEALACAQGRVVHLDYEQGRRLTAERYQRLARARGLTERDLEGLPLSVVVFPAEHIDTDRAEDWLCYECEGAALVLIDSFRAAATGIDENSSAAREPLDLLGRVSERTGAAFVVLHHARKPSAEETGPSRHALRGSGAIYDACQCVMVATPATNARQNQQGDESSPAQPPKLLLDKARLTGRSWEHAATYAIDDVGLDGNPRAGVSVSIVLPEARMTLPERLAWALTGKKEPLTANALKAELKCSHVAVMGAITALGARIQSHTIEVRGRPATGYTLVKS